MDEQFKVNTQVQNETKVITHSDRNFNVVDNNNSIVITTTVLGDTSQLTSDAVQESLRDGQRPSFGHRSQFASQWFEERRRQAKSSFNIAIVSAVISVVGGLVCAVSLYNGDIPEAAATAIMSLLSGGSSAHCFKLSDEANRRLDETAKELLDHE